MSVEVQPPVSRFSPARLKRAAKWVAGVLIVIAVTGFLVAPPLVRYFGERAVADLLGRKVTIDEVRMNPFAMSVTANGFRIAGADGQDNAFSFASLYVNLEAESIFRGAPVLREIRLESPQLHIARIDETHHSWSDVQARIEAMPKSADDKPALFSLNNIRLVDGAVTVEDQTVGVRNELTAINIGVPFLSNLPVKVELFTEPAISALVNGRPLQIGGRTQPFSPDRETALELTLDSFDFTPYLAYLPFKPAFRVSEGRVSTRIELSFAEVADGAPKIALKGSLDLASLRLQDAAGKDTLIIPQLSLGLADVQPLAGKLHFDRLEVAGPVVELVRLENGRLNVQEILPPSAGQDPAPEAATGATTPTVFTLDSVKVSGAEIHVEDRATGGDIFHTALKDVRLDARNVSTAADAVAELALDFTTDAGERSSHRDHVRLSPFVVDGKIEATNVLISRYAPYFGVFLPGGDIRDGRVDATLQYRIQAGKDAPQLELLAESLVVRDFELALKGQKQAAIKVPRLALGAVKVSPADQSVTVGTLESKGAAFAAVRDKQGKLDLLALAGDPKPAATPKATAQPAAKQWAIALDRLALEDWSVRFEDRTQEAPIVLLADAIRLGAEGLGTAKGAMTKLDLAARINKRGRIGVTGTAGIEPLKGELRLDLRAVDLLPLQPYVVEQLNIAITRGSLNTRGTLAFETTRDGSIGGRFRGDLGVDNFASIDKAQAADFLRWRTLGITGVDFRLAPLAVSVNEVVLDDFYTRLILDEQGQLNLREIRQHPRSEGEAAPEAGSTPAPAPATPGKAEATLPPPAPPPPLSIGKIAIRQGNIEFSDRFIRPNYDANLTGMEGELTGLSSDPSTIARLDLRGKVDNTAPVTVVGQLNPFRQDRYLDIAASVKDFELTGISAYSGKYVGYGIEKGKLSADLKYKIEDRKLTATNRVFLDQLTFGDKIDSPTALDLPVQLAVSLLKNGRGEIDLNVPVGGSLDDPEFSVAGIVFKAIINLIGKALTAPFSLLGSMFGGGEELSYVDFPAGRANIDAGAAERLVTLGRALADRPALKLEITGHADPASDPDGIRRIMLERSVKAAKLKEQVRKGEEVPSLDDITLDAAEYPVWLKKVYRDADFKRPRNAIGLLKDLPVEEMEALMLANIKVDDETLRQLAQQRAQTIKDRLLEGGKVPAERVFLLAPRVGAADGNKEGGEGAARRSMFSLK